VNAPRKPSLDRLITALTADGRPEELAGRDAALAAFRAAIHRDKAGGAARRRGAHSFRPLSARLAAVGAALVVAAGAAAAAYLQALPGPAQQLAHTVFAPLGVPNGQPPNHPSPGTGSTGVTSATTGGTTQRPTGGYRITVAVSRARVPAGTPVAFTGRVTHDGSADAGIRVRLFERIAGTATEQLVATGLTGPRGGFRLPSPPLTATAVFRVLGPDAAHSAAVRVAVGAPSPRALLP
jgi:hypothetical protein